MGLYSRGENLILGFHGCDGNLSKRVVLGLDELLKSRNDYDWLGHGIYFWENNLGRAWDFAFKQPGKARLDKPAVLGAVIALGNCLDLSDEDGISEIELAYHLFIKQDVVPNLNSGRGNSGFLRYLDCAVLEFLHKVRELSKLQQFDSVRGFFFEGSLLYPNSGFYAKTHIQLCIRNTSCIKGYFLPRP